MNRRTMAWACRWLGLLLAAAFATACASGSAMPVLPAGQGTYLFDGWAGPAVRVWYQVPERVTDTTPVVFVMHGRGRDADRYRDEWSGLAAEQGYILVVPEFSNAGFPKSRSYNHGNVFDGDGALVPRERWSFSAIEPLFDDIRRRTGTRVASYGIYGHSAGAQFVHRYVLFVPEARYHRAITANAGSYAMPDLSIAYPYGLAGAPADEATLRAALGKPVTVLLGTADNDPGHRSLPDDPGAKAQGPFRLARGEKFHATGKAAAKRLGAPFGWKIRYVEGVGHENGDMAIAAAPLLGR
ncbi:hypothetical protein [Luteimonas sp. R10]|uniref:hypothetical protein n=1 Tax=Luteimonas sp. R10 TaxID=3108176 RepID=UPI003084F243|nr:hypothetical protein U3649_05245 [Luteimonas sp. R10]